jgi:dienelactone hydrolase
MRAMLRLPDSGHGPGVLVLTAGARGDALAREALVRLAHHGYVALAADLPAPSGERPSAAEQAAVDAGIEQLFRESAVDGARVGVLAFGRGGLLAADAAERGARIGAVVAVDAGVDPTALDPGQSDRYDAVAARASWDAALARLRAELP